MLTQAVDLRAEADELHALLGKMHDMDWARPTLFKRWTVNDIVQHLHASDLLAAASVAGLEAFSRLQTEVNDLRNSGLSRLQETQHRLGHLTGKTLLNRWYEQVIDLSDKLAAMPPDKRLKWVGPDMGVRMFTTARQMEVWAHGQAIYDMMGEDRKATDRLRNIAEIGARTYGWTFANRKMPVPGPAPYIRLDTPSGGVWKWNDPSSDNCIKGDALGFCQVVTQVRSIADTVLTVNGEPARIWMSLAQCFAGPPEIPPPPGTRYRTQPH